MADMVYSIRVTLENIKILDDQDWFGAGEIYLLASIGGHSTGRSQIFKANSGDTIHLTGPQWSHEILVKGKSQVDIVVDVWDEDLIWDDALGRLMVSASPPWEAKRYTKTASSGNFILTWSVARTIIMASRAGVGMVSRQHDGSPYATTLSSPKVAVVVITEIRGLYKPGIDDRPPPIQAGTTKNAGYLAGYTSEDDKGRIFRNRALDGTWTKDVQYIELKAEIIPVGDALPGGCKIRWTVEDPDDPSNEGPTVHPDAGRLLDPNDYAGVVKTAAAANDNDPRGKKTAAPHLEKISATYALSGNETVIDIPTRTSKARFNTSDVLGDNYRIKAELVNVVGFDLVVPDQTGVMTVWERVEVEYVRMLSATELPVDQIAKHYDMACVQVDVSLKRIVSGSGNKAVMGATDAVAFPRVEAYCTSAWQFTKEGEKGWFFIAAANRMLPARSTTVLYQGDAMAAGDRIRLPVGTPVAPFVAHPAAVVRVFNPPLVAALGGTWPNDHGMHIKFKVLSRTGLEFAIEPHDFHLPEDPNVSFLDSGLTNYDFAVGTTLKVQVLSRGDDALVLAGISPGGLDDGGKHYFGGKLMVFTASISGPDVIVTLCHELCHAFDNAHKCGNWDWINQGTRTSCCMNYWFQFVLDDSAPRKPIPWTQNRQSPDLCGHHIRRMRDYHLEDNKGLGW